MTEQHDNAETLAAKEAAADYTYQMTEDAKAIAEKLVEELQKGNRQSPHPTLESIRAQIAAWNSSFELELTECLEIRSDAVVSHAHSNILRGLDSGDFAPVQKEFLDPKNGWPWEMHEMSENEWASYLLMRSTGNTTRALALGMYVGKLLGEKSFAMRDVLSLADDPVFHLHVLRGRVNRDSALQLALEHLESIEKLGAKASAQAEREVPPTASDSEF